MLNTQQIKSLFPEVELAGVRMVTEMGQSNARKALCNELKQLRTTKSEQNNSLLAETLKAGLRLTYDYQRDKLESAQFFCK